MRPRHSVYSLPAWASCEKMAPANLHGLLQQSLFAPPVIEQALAIVQCELPQGQQLVGFERWRSIGRSFPDCTARRHGFGTLRIDTRLLSIEGAECRGPAPLFGGKDGSRIGAITPLDRGIERVEIEWSKERKGKDEAGHARLLAARVVTWLGLCYRRKILTATIAVGNPTISAPMKA